MTDLPQEAFVTRDDPDPVLKTAFERAHNWAAERNLSHKIAFWSGWAFASVVTFLFWQDQQIIANRPIPKDRIFISFINENGLPVTQSRPVEDLNTSQKKLVIMQFVGEYARHRLTYTYGGQPTDYDFVRFTTEGSEQKRYIDHMTIVADRPSEVYGTKGKVEVTYEGMPYPIGPFTWEVPVKVKETTKQGIELPEKAIRARVDMQVTPDMPTEIAHRIDPLRLSVTAWTLEPWQYDPAKIGGMR